MPRHLVFVGAPTPDITRVTYPELFASHRWQTVVEDDSSAAREFAIPAASVTDAYYKLPPATLEEASRRISRMYENIIFGDIEDPEDENVAVLDESRMHDTREQTTLITWPPTLPPGDDGDSCLVDRPDVTFLRPTASFSRSIQRSRHKKETQESQYTNSYSYSYNDSSDASVARFPHFHFSLHSVTSLATLISQLKYTRAAVNHGDPSRSLKHKVNLLAAVLEAEGPDTIRIKKGPDAGKEVSLLKIVIGDEEGQVCRLTAWREVAERWGGSYPDETSLQRGDVVYLQDVLASADAATLSHSSSVSLAASPALKSSMLICYRTMPRLTDRAAGINDEQFQPDLRLGSSDATVRKVAGLVRWFEEMAGLPHG